ncbi:MAG: 50S ribosomal protein L29 [bacterium]|nr:50S ribosomal protein L29 [bacterium]
MLKAKELRQRNIEELTKTLHEERVRLSDLNFKLVGAQLKNVSEFSKIKKNIAVLATIINEKNA